MQGNRALGYGLLAAGAGIAVLMLIWLAVSGAEGGGIVLGLILLFVLAGPLAGGGWYVLQHQKTEEVEEQAFLSKRRIVDADKLFRQEIAGELRQLASQPSLPSRRLRELAEDMERRGYESPEWYDTVRLSDDDIQVLRQYDDLVWERVRRLQRLPDQVDQDTAEKAVGELETAMDQRRDLLLRGRRAPTAAPSAILRSGTPARGADAVANLGVSDAISYEGDDYLVEGLATYFAEGQQWKLAHLVPSGPGPTGRWLYVAPGGLAVALLTEIDRPGRPGDTLTVDGETLPLANDGSATVDVTSQSGTARGILVAYRSYRAGRSLGFYETWPDGATHAYGGQIIPASDFEVWPAAVR